MLFSRSLIASALLGVAVATTHAGEAMVPSETLAAMPSASAPAAPPSQMPAAGMVNTHVVQVGGPNGSLVFSPENIIAQPGDLVQFQFNPKNHSVSQSTFDNPCVPIQNIMPNKTDAFFSGFMPSNATAVAAKNVLTYTIRVMDTKPIWYYCSQGQHCQAGMVGAINAAATGNKTMSSFKQLAAAAPENLSPGQASAPGDAVQPPGAPAPSESAAVGGGDATETAAGGNIASASSNDNPPEATVSAAGHVSQSFLSFALTMLAAFLLL